MHPLVGITLPSNFIFSVFLQLLAHFSTDGFFIKVKTEIEKICE